MSFFKGSACDAFWTPLDLLIPSSLQSPTMPHGFLELHDNSMIPLFHLAKLR